MIAAAMPSVACTVTDGSVAGTTCRTRTRTGRAPSARAACYVLQLPQLEDLPAHESRVAHPPDDDERQDHVVQARTENGHERDREQDAGKRQQDIHQPPEHLVDPSAGVSCHRADGDTDRRRESNDGETHEERHACAHDEARQYVPPELVHAERVLP